MRTSQTITRNALKGARENARENAPKRPLGPARAGFSFTEILFSVIILGIGFIMVAAIFPVAIEQGKLTNEQTVAASIGRGALSLMGQVASNSDAGVVSSCGSLTFTNAATFTATYANTVGGPLFPATGVSSSAMTGNVWSFRDPGIGTFAQLNGSATFSFNNGTINTAIGRVVDEVWDRASQNLILPTDPRYAFIGMYRRDGDPGNRKTWSPFAQVWFIPVTARSRTVYDNLTAQATNKDIGTGNASTNLSARVVQVRVDVAPGTSYTTQGNQGYILYNYITPAGSPYTSSAIVTGCYVIIARDNIVSSPAGAFVPDSGRMNGRTYHVGARRPDLDTSTTSDPDKLAAQAFELAPDGDFVPDAGADTVFGSVDDIYSIGNKVVATVNGLAMTTAAGAPADAYVIGTDNTGADPGLAQDVSAFSTFIKVN